jgi:phosphomevalonate kinase
MDMRIIIELFLKRWDNRIKIFKLPPGLELVLGEVDTGSNTPKMVSNVLEWRKNDPDSGNSI